MSAMYEVCKVRIRWLEPGEVGYQSELDDEHDFYNAHNIVCWRGPDGWMTAWNKDFDPDKVRTFVSLDKEALLNCLYRSYVASRTNDMDYKVDWQIDPHYSPNDPVMEVNVPVTVFEFEIGDSHENWLAYEAGDIGVWDVFKDDLVALENIGLWLWKNGQAVDHDRWGVTVCFYAVWLYTVHTDSDGDQEATKTFRGWLDMRRALETMAVMPPVTERPFRKPVLQHRLLEINL